MTKIENVTTGAIVRSKGVPKAAVVVFIIFFIAILAWIVYSVLIGSGPPPGFPEIPE
ncbi:hypothetical protein HW130_33365 [Streptomyces sp. PKU-EA00015]|uniref:hypothetical protein n=1 Tax=Streptomyces sp. PKU-EA00015 TaxID=2748326 RepID=UPI0015A424C0|nr:hypothetical protein [Streptomyces sp. PKU-EA00015]NWF31076.1 hypothetical protein [Streptomyces sp. PKU-EA00015]